MRITAAPPLPEPIFLCLPTRDGTAQVRSIETFELCALQLRRPLVIVMAEASNIPRARNGIHDGLRQAGLTATTRVWWMDSDMRFGVEALPHLQRMMAIGEREPLHVLVAAHYRMADGRWQGLLAREGDVHIEALPDKESSYYAKGASGFGLVYGSTDPAYVWHADREGEDVWWWRDHPGAAVRFYNAWHPGHAKEVVLG